MRFTRHCTQLLVLVQNDQATAGDVTFDETVNVRATGQFGSGASVRSTANATNPYAPRVADIEPETLPKRRTVPRSPTLPASAPVG